MAIDLYRNRDFIPDFDTLVAETAARSRAFAQQANVHADVPYGSRPRETMDIILPPRQRSGAPLHLFIHGGYWRTGSKEDHHLVAAPVLAAGAVAAIVTYDLMPQTRLGAIVGQIRAAARHLIKLAPQFGADASRLSVSGHSAGAHLATYLAAYGPEEHTVPKLAPPRSMLLISGLYDLADIPHSFLKHENQMTPAEAGAWSPLSSHHLPGPRRVIMVAEHDTPPFHIQGEQLAQKLGDAGHKVEFRVEPALNHLSIVLELGDPHSRVGQCLADLVEQA